MPFTPVSNAVFSDDFSGPTLDPEKWLAPEASGIVGQSGGQLRFVVRPGAEINTSLEPVTLTRAFEQMTFDVTIPQYAKAGPGGVALILNPRSDRPQWLAFGPSPEGRTIYPLICAKAKCTNGVYEDFVEPTGSAVAKVAANEAVPVKLVRANGRLRFYVRNMLVGETPVDPGSLTDFRFAISAADTESWDIEVDNIVCQ